MTDANRNVCIILRNINSELSAIDYEPIVNCFMNKGYNMNKVVLLPFDDIALLDETISYEKNCHDNIFIIAEKVLINSLKAELSRLLGEEFVADYVLFTMEKNYFVCPSGKEGAALAENVIIPYLNKHFGVTHAKLTIKMIGAPMDRVKSAINDSSALSRNTLGFNVTESFGDIRLDVVYDGTTPKILLDEVTRIITEYLGDFIYSIGKDEKIEERLYEALKLRRYKISVAESFTGGGIAQKLVSVPGISAVYKEGLNTYSNDSKIKRLGVENSTIFSYGAVSDEVAYEMASGLLSQGGIDMAISTTGVAGPDSDGSSAPVGLCYIGVGIRNQVYVYKFNLSGDREKITKTAINFALFQAFKLIK